MANKRRNSDSLKSVAAPKKMKPSDSEFNGTVFKSMLKDPSKAFKGLETFIRTAQKLPSTSVYDVVEGYIKISAECEEIFLLMDGNNCSEAELVLILKSLELILLRTASDLSQFAIVGSTIVMKITSTHMRLMQTSLCSMNYRLVRQSLSLLAVMVSQGADAAREVFSSLDLNKSLVSLVQRRDRTGQPDVRTAYIQFALSFLIYGDCSTIGHILETKDFLTAILTTGLNEDRVSIISLLLSTLQNKIVQNTAISKTQKVRFFCASTLAQIACLYKWNGVMDATTNQSEALNVQEEGRLHVRELVHNFLLDLCCSRKHGISFHDPCIGTSKRTGNIVLLQFAVGLKQAINDDLVADLLISILKCCPDVLHRYFKETQFSFTPRLKGTWLDSIALLKKIYQAQPEVSPAFQLQETISCQRLLSMVLITSIPSVCNKSFFTQGLNLPSVTAQYATISMLDFVLRRAQKNMEQNLKTPVWNSLSATEFVQLYREALSKILPDVAFLVSKWQSLSVKETEKSDGKTNLKAADFNTSDLGEQASEQILFKALLLQVIRLYQKIVPHFISQSRFDFSKLIKGTVSKIGMEMEVPAVLHYQLIQLALELPASNFSWLRLKDGGDPLLENREKSFSLLLKMFISSSSHLRISTRILILKVLRNHGVFEHTWRELELWLNHLLCLEPPKQEIIIQFLDQVMMKVVTKPYAYMDKVEAVVQEAVSLQALFSDQARDRDIDSIVKSQTDNQVCAFDDTLKRSVEDTGPSHTVEFALQTFPFSAMVPAALEVRNKQVNSRDLKGVVFEYLCAVLCEILHNQRDPLALCLTLQRFDSELLETATVPLLCLKAFYVYYSKWLLPQPHNALYDLEQSTTIPLQTQGFAEFLKTCYCEGPAAFLRDTFRQDLQSVTTLQQSQFTLAVNQVLLYLRTFVNTFNLLPRSQAGKVVDCLLEVIHDILLKLQRPAERSHGLCETNEQEEVSLDINFAVAQDDSYKDQGLIDVYRSVFKHPVLQHWFLAAELGLMPHHSLEPETARQLCGLLTEGVITLLKCCAETLNNLHALELISPYLSATKHSLLKELQHSNRCFKESKPVRAFLALHEYMELSCLKELLSALLHLPKGSLLVGRDEMSVYGHAVLAVLTKYSAQPTLGDDIHYIIQSNMQSIAAFHTFCPSTQLENLLLQVLRRDLGNAKLIPAEVLLCCLRSHSSLDLATLLVQNCSTHCLTFELWCLEQTDLTHITAQNSSFFGLLTSYLQQAAFEDPCRPKDIQESVLQMLKKTLLPKLVISVLEEEVSVDLVKHAELLSSFIRLGATSDLTDLKTTLPILLQKPENYERWQLADALMDKLINTAEEVPWRKLLITAALRWLSTTYKEKKIQLGQTEEAMLHRLKTLLDCTENVSVLDWNTFVKNGLKFRFQDRSFLDILNFFLKFLYGVEGEKRLLPIETLNGMVTSHSLFLPTLLASQNDAGVHCETKDALVSLLLTLVRTYPEVCSSNLFIVLLGAYGATLSPTDQKLFLLLQECDRSNAGLMDSQCLLWGSKAMEYYKAKKSLGPSLWQQPNSEQLLGQLNVEWMQNTVAHFPMQRNLIPQEGEDHIFKNEEDYPNSLRLYDPCFLLPLFSLMLCPASVVNCQKFVSSHALGVTVMALSSYDYKMRAAAYHVLGSFYQHLEGAYFREKKQLLYLLETIKNAVHKPNLRVSFMHSTYIAKAAQQILRPEEHMYLVINKFLLGTQYVDLKRFPDFFRLYFSCDLEHKQEREWVLCVLQEGIKDRLSYELCEQQGICHTLLGFCSSPHCEQSVQIEIFKVLKKAAHVTKAAYDLVHAHGVLTCVVQLLDKKFVSSSLLSTAVELLHALWFTILAHEEKRRQRNSASAGQHHNLDICLSFPDVSAFLSALLSVIKHLRCAMEAQHLKWFLQTLDSVLQRHSMTESVHKDAGWLMPHPQTLSCSEALSLLHSWGTLARDTTLLLELQNMATKLNIKSLLGSGEEKVPGKDALKPSVSCMEYLSELDDGGVEKQSLLNDCEQLLVICLTHWEPGPLTLDYKTTAAALNPEKRTEGQASDISNSSNLINETASTLLKWILRTLCKRPYDENNTYATLKLLQKVVFPFKTVAESLLADEAMRIALLKVYLKACECRVQEQFIPKLEARELFTIIMVHFLETEITPDVLHMNVINTCLHSSTSSAANREPGLRLLSLYIHELWTGAKVPQLLLTHARMVTRETKTQKATPLAQICNDILSAVESDVFL